MLKDNKGISLTLAVITVLAFIIILSTISFSAVNSVKMRKLNKLYNDCSRFCKKYINKLDFDRSVKNDIESSMKNIELFIK